ncbi:HEAT repeat domain-containing protein [Acetivibrio straminisolvens]|uniref:Uncharacterized protein n=1 Tax=Acetivibrio straminisolvens JCM 21531 TaxID=1294263 RepID=W4V7W7_9FIRM|nr:hypothetical protein [Acetivibrio straminisolvens]GAE89455.1 hypothetical protein JCM21531_2985 [Acetivibrio straminisolvens JCM 21531]
MKKAELLFESYNMVIEESCNRIFMNGEDDILKIGEDRLSELVDEDLKKWAKAPLKELDGLCPDEYFKSISDIGQLLELFKLGAKMCDMHLPHSLIEKIATYNGVAEEEMLKLATDRSVQNNDEELVSSLTAISILGEWKAERAVGPLMKLAENLEVGINMNDEIVLEKVIDALAQIGGEAVPVIVDRLNSIEDFGILDEYLLTCLTKIEAKALDKDVYDTVYRCLKNSFLRMKNKAFGAVCLGDFGDGRAIPALKGYILKNMESIDYETYCDIHSAVIRLGGNMDDIKINFA